MRVAGTPGPTVGKQPAQRREARLRRAAVQFESLFLQQMLNSMRATVPESGLMDGGGEMKLYRQMLDEELAKKVAGDSRFGIADMLVKRYLPLVEREESARPLDAGGTQGRDVPATAPRRPTAAGDGTPRALLERAVAAYRQGSRPAGAADEGIDAALRARAEELGGAVADTLRRFAGPIARASRETGLPPSLLLSVVTAESGGRTDAVSSRGAQGLMQLMPETAAEVGVDDPFDPEQNLLGGARYLAKLRERFDGDLALALAGYNAGPGNVERAGRAVPPFRETRHYVDKVVELYRRLEPDASRVQEARHGS